MGIFIDLKIIPQRIAPDKWKKVYQETLHLIDHYAFMDRIEAVRNGLPYSFSARTKDRENLFGTGYHGWNSIGDLRTGENTENYVLYGDIHAYLPDGQTKDNGADILCAVLPDMDDIIKTSGCINIWGNKTQGEDSHIYLLAVACLITDRFPEAAMVSGDISAGQCRKAVAWANQYLDTPIGLPVTAVREKLLMRVRQSGIPGDKQLEAFYLLTLEAKDAGLGAFVRREFSAEEIAQRYRECFTRFQIDQHGFSAYMKEYLEMGYDFKELCRIVVESPKGMQAGPEEFLHKIIESKLHIKSKETFDYTKLSTENADCGEVDNIQKMFAKVMGRLCGAGNRNVNAFYPLEKIVEDSQEVFGSQCDVPSLIESLLKESEENGSGDILQSVLYDDADSVCRQDDLRKNRKACEEEKYDINSYRELADFIPGCRMKPELEADIIKNFRMLHQFAQEEYEEFRVLDRVQRENFFIRNNQDILLHKSVWDIIFGRVMDDAYIERIYSLFHVNCAKKDGYNFCRNLFANIQALDYYWDRTKDV
ncbi:MAG: hypothetical protein HFI43_11665 [Lachnospiraceae bacterium]|jgi:hypothetical protein|nr:hypothetical protein [Lachnospiraceae bacterium]GFI18043.1 hypothetical protein IMSAGC009_03215 [Lachnospiraceae bacterium]